MSPYGAYKAFRCCSILVLMQQCLWGNLCLHVALMKLVGVVIGSWCCWTFLQVFLVFHVHVSSISIIWAVFTCKVNVYHKNCFSWLRGNLCQFPCGSDWSCLPFFDYFSFHFFFQYQIFLVLNATTTSLSDSEILHAPGCILISWEVFEKTFSRCSLFHWYPPREILHRQ